MILLDSCLLASDASHLRHDAPASFKTICLLIDLSLVGGVGECFGEKMYFDRFSAHDCAYERVGP